MLEHRTLNDAGFDITPIKLVDNSDYKPDEKKLKERIEELEGIKKEHGHLFVSE